MSTSLALYHTKAVRVATLGCAGFALAALLLLGSARGASAQTFDRDAGGPPATPVPAAAVVALEEPAQAAVAETVLAVAKVITYQGRLLTPTTGVNKPDGNYEMSFRLYNHATATAQANLLWVETQTVPVAKGLFTVALGSVTPFPATLFNGQELWLGATVGTDPELAPRTRITAVAYALYADNADRLDGIDSTTFATDAEVMPIVLANDGTGSGLNADVLDGLSSASFAKFTFGTYDSPITLSVGQSYTWHSHGYAESDIYFWLPRAMTNDSEFTISVEYRRHVTGTIAYLITVTNTGPVNGVFQLTYLRFYN